MWKFSECGLRVYRDTQTVFSFFIFIFYECIVIFSKDIRYAMIASVWWLMTCACVISCIKIFLHLLLIEYPSTDITYLNKKNLWDSQYFSVWRATDDKKLRTFKLIFLQKKFLWGWCYYLWLTNGKIDFRKSSYIYMMWQN